MTEESLSNTGRISAVIQIAYRKTYMHVHVDGEAYMIYQKKRLIWPNTADVFE